MPLFRKHLGQLSESLKTSVIVKNMQELRRVIYEDWEMWEGALTKDGHPFSQDSFRLKIGPYYGLIDERCGWYTQIVIADLEEKDKFMIVGFLSEPMEEVNV